MPPAAYTLQASASTFCAGSTAGVLFALSGTQDGVSYQLYKDGGTPVGSVLSGTNGAATFSGTFNVAGSYTVRSVASGRYCGGMATSGTLVASAIPLPSPAVVDASFCYGLPGQLQAVPAGSVTIAWYDASTAGNLLYTGNVLPLTPLYSDAASYFARAVLASDPSCVSVGTPASYTVAHCMLDGYCPGFVAGNVGPVSSSDVAACGVYDSGRIGLVNDQAACGVFYPGQIGATGYPAACVSYDAGWIGRN
jgi:hypothetical protein